MWEFWNWMFALYPKDFDSSFDFCGSLFKLWSSDWKSEIDVWKNQNVKSFCAHKNSLRWKKSKFKSIQYFMFVFLTCCAFHFPFHAIWTYTFPFCSTSTIFMSTIIFQCIMHVTKFISILHTSNNYTLSFSWLRNCNLFSSYELPFHDTVDQNTA